MPTTAAAPVLAPAASGTLSELLVAAVTHHAGLGRIPTVDERIAALASVLADSRWRSYRAGRVRVAGLTGVYWHWLAPPLDMYRPAVGELPLEWTDGTTVFADVFVVDETFTCAETVERVTVTSETGRRIHGDRFAGVRVLHLAAPHRSRLNTGSGDRPLIDTPLWFGGRP